MNRWVFGGGIGVAIAGLSAYALTDRTLQTNQSTISAEHEQFYQQMVEKAKDLQKQDQPTEAIAQVAGVPSNSKHFAIARSLSESLSQQILDQARTQHRQGNPDRAIALLRSIPAATSVSSTAQTLKTSWTTENQHFQAMQKAAESRNWTEAMRHIDQLKGTETYNNPRVQSALQQAINATEPPLVTVRPVFDNASASIPQFPMVAVAPVPAPPPSVAVDASDALTTTEQRLPPSRIAPVNRSIPLPPPLVLSAVVQTTPALVQPLNRQSNPSQRNLSKSPAIQTPVSPPSNTGSPAILPRVSPEQIGRENKFPNSSPIPIAVTRAFPRSQSPESTRLNEPISATSITEMMQVQTAEPTVVRPSVARLSRLTQSLQTTALNKLHQKTAPSVLPSLAEQTVSALLYQSPEIDQTLQTFN